MPAVKLLNIFALSTLAILFCTFAPSQTLAVSVRSNHMARHVPNHHGIAKKKKRGNKRCKPRSSSSSLPDPANPSDPTNTPVPDNYSPPPTTSPPVDTPYLPTTTTTTSPNSVATYPPSSTPSGSGKLAIAWAMGDDPRISLLVGAAKMFHLWDCQIPDAVKSTGIPVSIMLWGVTQDKIDPFVQVAVAGYASYAYGFNEVNEGSQANVDPGTAVGVWNQYLRPLSSQGYTLGGPVTSSNPNGYDWMTQFFSICGGDCGMNEMPVHWYDVQFTDFQAYIEKWAGFGKPIRVTEFACQNFNGGNSVSTDDIWAFTDSAIPYLEGNPTVLSYAPFGFMDDMYNVTPDDCLFTSTGLSDLGWKYVNS